LVGLMAEQNDCEIIAYELQPPMLRLGVGAHDRAWMDAIPDRTAYRCLPMLIANQAGWTVASRGRLRATWNGGPLPSDLRVDTEDCPEAPLSHFGYGILTWRIPYLFRTPRGWNLLMRGPANSPKDGASSLEGVIEADWAVQPAFHSWQLTRPRLSVVWEDGEVICMIVPQRRGELEAFRPRTESILDHPGVRAEYEIFSEGRTAFNSNRGERKWERHYFHGRSPGAAAAPAGAHQTKLRLQPFGSS
jgi:hypothetical protein